MKASNETKGVGVDNSHKRQVLFLGLTDYNLSKDDYVLKEKWEGLAQDMHVYVLARGRGWHTHAYGADFYLFPKFFGRLSPLLWGKAAFWWGLYLVFTKKIDVIISQSPSIEGFVATLLAKLTGRKLVIEVHGDWVNGPFYYYRIPLEGFVKGILRGLGKF